MPLAPQFSYLYLVILYQLRPTLWGTSFVPPSQFHDPDQLMTLTAETLVHILGHLSRSFTYGYHQITVFSIMDQQLLFPVIDTPKGNLDVARSMGEILASDSPHCFVADYLSAVSPYSSLGHQLSPTMLLATWLSS